MHVADDQPAEEDDAPAIAAGTRPRRYRFGAVLEWLLGIAIVFGGVLAVRSGRERSELRMEYQRLVRTVGELPVTDPAKAWVMALETGDPMHFAWRVYLPANYHLLVSHDNGSVSSRHGDSAEFVARIRFRVADDDRLQVYSHYGSGSSLSSRGDGAVAKFIQQHWDRLKVEQLGAEGAVSMEPADAATLLRLQMPEDLQTEAASIFPQRLQSKFIPTYFNVTLGPAMSAP